MSFNNSFATFSDEAEFCPLTNGLFSEIKVCGLSKNDGCDDLSISKQHKYDLCSFKWCN